MGAGSGIALKSLQWFVRGIQFSCAALIFALYSYFLATLHNHDLDIGTDIKAVEGITGIAIIYTAFGLLLLCCLAGHPFTSALAILLDICFVVCFIYVAVVNRGGASSCNGYVNTPFGSGDSNTDVRDNGANGWTALPSLHQACQMESACLAVAIVAVLFFVFSAILELVLVRHHRKEKRFGPSPANDYTSGYGKKGGFFSRFSMRRKRNTGLSQDPNMLPEHTHPDAVRDSYATERTRVGTGHGEPGTGYNKYGEVGFGHQNGINEAHPAPSAAPPAGYRYDDGVYDNHNRFV